MRLIEAQQNASRILDAERTMPTITYISPAPFANEAAFAVSSLGQRGRHPRPVSETPGYFLLKSRNYDYLKSYFEDLAPNDRPLFFGKPRGAPGSPKLFKGVGEGVLTAGRTDRIQPELPLIAEFLV